MTCYFPEACQAARKCRSQPCSTAEPGAERGCDGPPPRPLGAVSCAKPATPLACRPSPVVGTHSVLAVAGESHLGPVGYLPLLCR